MEKRKQKRIVVGYKAEIIGNGRSYECVIENLSVTGVNVITSPGASDFISGESVELKFEPRPGETVNVGCTIMWCRETLPHGLTSRLGLEISDPDWCDSGPFV